MEWTRESTIISQMEKLVVHAEKAEKQFTSTFQLHISGEHGGIFQFGVDLLKSIETETDSIVADIKNELYTSKYADLRDDRTVLVTIIDTIIDDMTELLQEISIKKIITPATRASLYTNLLEAISECVQQTFALVHKSLYKRAQKEIALLVDEVGEAESRCDSLEDHLIEIIFRDNEKSADQIIQDLVITRLGKIADRCEDLAEHIGLVNLKMVE